MRGTDRTGGEWLKKQDGPKYKSIGEVVKYGRMTFVMFDNGKVFRLYQDSPPRLRYPVPAEKDQLALCLLERRLLKNKLLNLNS